MSFTASHRYPAITILALAALAAAFVLGSGIKAQAQSEESPAGLVGTWTVQGTLVNCTTGAPLGAPPVPSLVSFARGGTATAVVSSPLFLPGQRTPSLGVWTAIGPQTYRLVHEAFILFDGGPFLKGTQKITEIIELDGDQYLSVASSQFFAANGTPLGSPGCARAVGNRLQ